MCFLRCGLLNSGTNQCLMNICSHACMFTQNLGSVEEYVSIQTLIWTTKYCLEFRAHIIVHLWKPWWQNMFTKLTLNYLIQIVQESICKTWPQIHAFIRLFVRSFRFYWSWRSFGSVEIWRHFLCTFARHLWVNPRIRQGCCECSKMHRIILLDLVCQISQSHRHVMQTAGFLDNDGKPVDVPRSTTMHYFGPGRADSLGSWEIKITSVPLDFFDDKFIIYILLECNGQENKHILINSTWHVRWFGMSLCGTWKVT